MKIISKQYDGNGYVSKVAVPTTKLEHKMLQALKYSICDNSGLCDWHPEWLGEDLAVRYANSLGYSNVIFNWEDEFMDYSDEEGNTWKLTATPSNLETILAGYRLLGRHRKVAQILKKIKDLKLEGWVTNMEPGRQQA